MNAGKKHRAPKRSFGLKRIYDAAEDGDGYRVLVDRLWPRGVSKDKAQIDLWLKEIAPSDALRRRFHGEPGKWKEFVALYRKELASEPAKSAAVVLRERLGEGPVTLLYAARNREQNNAVALMDWLIGRV